MSKFRTALARLRNTPHIGRDVGAIVALLAAGAVAVGYLFVHYQIVMPFNHNFHFSAEFDQAPAIQLAARQEVRIAGVSVGRITGDGIAPDGHARVDLEIDAGHPVYKDARVVLASKTPLNVVYVSLDPGHASAGQISAGGVIPVSQTSRITQPYELLDQLDERTRAALTSLVDDGAVAFTNSQSVLPQDLATLRTAMQSFQPVVDALAQRRENLRRLVTSVSQIATAAGGNQQRLASLAADLETTLGVVSARENQLGSTLQQLPALTSTLRTAMAKGAGLADQLTPTLDALSGASGKLPKVLADLAATVGKAQSVITAARPVVSKARPVLQNLSPLASDLNLALGSLSPVTSNLPAATQKLVPWLNDLGGFVYNTSSSFSLGDVNGGLGRANLIVKLYNPTGGGL